MKRKFTDHELKEFVSGKIKNKQANESDLEQMAGEIKDSPDDFEYVSFLKSTRDFVPVHKEYTISSELQKIIEDMPENPSPRETPDTNELKFGQILSTTVPANWPWKAQETRWVLLLSDISGSIYADLPDVKAAPISFETEYATDTDMIINDPQVLNGHSFMIRFGDVQNIFAVQLKDYYGKIPKRYYTNIKQAWKYASGLTDQPAENSGSAIEQDDDPRVSFMLEEHDLTEYMRKPVNDIIALLEEEQQEETGQNEIETPGNVIPLDYVIPADWLYASEGYPLAAAKEKHFSLSEGRLFLVFESNRLKLRLHITAEGMQLRMQVAKPDEEYRLTVKSSQGDVLLEPTNQPIIPLTPAERFLNRSLRIEVKSAFFTKTIRTKFFHGFFNAK